MLGGRGGCMTLRGVARMFGKDSILLHCAYDTLLCSPLAWISIEINGEGIFL